MEKELDTHTSVRFARKRSATGEVMNEGWHDNGAIKDMCFKYEKDVVDHIRKIMVIDEQFKHEAAEASDDRVMEIGRNFYDIYHTTFTVDDNDYFLEDGSHVTIERPAKVLKEFLLTFDDGTSGITRHYKMSAVKDFYLNNDVRKDDGMLAKCIRITELK